MTRSPSPRTARRRAPRLPAAALALALIAAAALAAPAGAGEDDAPAAAQFARAFRTVIRAQLEAFANDDAAAAFAFAAPSIQALFGTPERFMAMVRGGYRPVYRPRSVRFEAPIEADGFYAQPVRVVGPDGRLVLAMYHMEEQPDGSWRIAGVVLRPLNEREG